MGALMLDSNDPSKVIAHSDNPVMEPVIEYEKTVFFGNVVFTYGRLVDGDTVTLYYGVSDEVISASKPSVLVTSSPFRHFHRP
jgi:predicted GH43/DUF377 family glycosyl hydrolase